MITREKILKKLTEGGSKPFRLECITDEKTFVNAYIKAVKICGVMNNMRNLSDKQREALTRELIKRNDDFLNTVNIIKIT